jgi:hypothetical protein
MPQQLIQTIDPNKFASRCLKRAGEGECHEVIVFARKIHAQAKKLVVTRVN